MSSDASSGFPRRLWVSFYSQTTNMQLFKFFENHRSNFSQEFSSQCFQSFIFSPNRSSACLPTISQWVHQNLLAQHILTTTNDFQKARKLIFLSIVAVMAISFGCYIFLPHQPSRQDFNQTEVQNCDVWVSLKSILFVVTLDELFRIS